MALVPVNPETFGVLLYSLWWATLWPVIILGWRRPLYGLRLPLQLAASLSSPGGGALVIVFLAAFVRQRRPHDLIGTVILTAGFGVELTTFSRSARGSVVSQGSNLWDLFEQCLRTGGFYLFRWDMPTTGSSVFLAFIGLVLFGGLLAAALFLWHESDELVLLLAAAALFTVLSGQPAPLVTDPLTVGRYYFLPFIVLSWILISLAVSPLDRLRGHGSGIQLVKVSSSILIGVSLLGLPAAFSRSPATTTARLSWAEEVRHCAASKKSHVAIPVYLDGSTSVFWSDIVTPSACRRLSHERL